MTRGVVFMVTGKRHVVVMAISLFTLRQVYQGPVIIYCDDDALPFVTLIAKDGDAEVKVFKRRQAPNHRNSGYLNKTRIPGMSPFDSTLQVDADTIFVGDISPLFPTDLGRLVLTQFSGWVTTGRLLKRRIGMYEDIMPETVKQLRTESWPAVNTGVVAYGRDCVAAKETWPEVTGKKAGKFIVDEIAMQVMLPRIETMTIMDDRWNCSPTHGMNKDRAVIWHFHGKKHMRKASGRALWLPCFAEAEERGFAGIGEWAYENDPNLKKFRHAGLD